MHEMIRFDEMIRLAYARNTISNVIMLQNMSRNIRRLMKKEEK